MSSESLMRHLEKKTGKNRLATWPYFRCRKRLPRAKQIEGVPGAGDNNEPAPKHLMNCVAGNKTLVTRNVH